MDNYLEKNVDRGISMLLNKLPDYSTPQVMTQQSLPSQLGSVYHPYFKWVWESVIKGYRPQSQSVYSNFLPFVAWGYQNLDPRLMAKTVDDIGSYFRFEMGIGPTDPNFFYEHYIEKFFHPLTLSNEKQIHYYEVPLIFCTKDDLNSYDRIPKSVYDNYTQAFLVWG